MPLPFFAPIFAILLTAAPAPPMGLKGLLGLCVVVIVTLGVGLLLTPLLGKYPVSALLIIAAGLYVSTIISVGLRKASVGALLTIGFTLIPAAGLVEYALAVTLVKALLLGIALAIASQWIVYPFFPENPPGAAPAKPPPIDTADDAMDRVAVHADRAGARDAGFHQSSAVPAHDHEIRAAGPAGLRRQRANRRSRNARTPHSSPACLPSCSGSR